MLDQQYKTAIELIDKVHNQDPTSEIIDGVEVMAELLYSNRMLAVLEKVAPDASLELKLAAKCQHISRWSIPRATFPIGKKGYYEWRAAIMEHQLNVSKSVLKQSGINDQSIEIVVDALKNKADKTNINASIIEDTACLTFIKWYLVPFAGQFDAEKAKIILQKTAGKMSERGLALIPELELSDAVLRIL
ncbi:MAG TPA: DUF4202 domain-containing protein, partial [Paludibacter sp.]|nr:DUF4202 domain-containing protein [Paludibacter sp.]